jgi:hypothetical protein
LSDPGFLGLVREHVRSVWDLELLLFLRGHPGEAWRAEDLVLELRASAPLIADSLARLQASGFAVEDDDGWRFAPATPELERFCDQLGKAYRTRPVALINQITAPNPS